MNEATATGAYLLRDQAPPPQRPAGIECLGLVWSRRYGLAVLAQVMGTTRTWCQTHDPIIRGQGLVPSQFVTTMSLSNDPWSVKKRASSSSVEIATSAASSGTDPTS
jgi:hypothetical protein